MSDAPVTFSGCWIATPKRVYAVFRQAVYRHACAGVYSTVEQAIAVADDMARMDTDDHHTYEVMPFDLDAPPVVEPAPWNRFSPDILEAGAIYGVTRSKVLAKTEGADE